MHVCLSVCVFVMFRLTNVTLISLRLHIFCNSTTSSRLAISFRLVKSAKHNNSVTDPILLIQLIPHTKGTTYDSRAYITALEEHKI